MALTFKDVYRAELAEIRERRLHLWQVEQIRRRKSRDGATGEDPAQSEAKAEAEAEPQPPGQNDRVFEGIPKPPPPQDDGARPLVLDKILEELEDARKSFLEEQKCRAARQRNRQADGGAEAADSGKAGTADGPAQDHHYGLTGLALSGGGVRSSTFCLGALQALAKWGVFAKFDYLSTVSGGGFIGSCVSSLHADGSTEFPFDHKPGVPEGQPLRYLRNHANYLAPRGLADYLKAPGLLLRGILVNFLIILPYVLIAAIATALIAGPMIRNAVQVYAGLVPGIRLEDTAVAGRNIVLSGSVAYTGWFVLAFFLVLVAYPIAQALGNLFGWSNWERRNRGNALLSFGLIFTLCVAAVEAQPIAIYYSALLSSSPWIKGDYISLDVLVGVFSAVAGLGATASGKLAPKANRWSAKVALYAIGLLGPLVLWLIYLMLTRWAVCGPPQWTGAVAEYFGYGPWPGLDTLCFGESLGGSPGEMTWSVAFVFAGVALGIWAYGYFFINANRNSLHAYYRDRLSRAYLFKRNRPDSVANPDRGAADTHVVHNDKQLLQDLRERKFVASLSERLRTIGGQLSQVSWRSLSDLRSALSVPRRSAADPHIAPYHLINATINVRRPRNRLVDEGDTPVNRAARESDVHGRKADFFLFSPFYIGSKVTSYCKTKDMHKVDRHVDLGTAMAISGAAAAPNMGTSTVRPLVFILTLLNVRLGYWLPNPRAVHQRFQREPETDPPARKESAGRLRRMREGVAKAWKKFLYFLRLTYRVGPLYLLFEMFGLLNQEWPFINVSDGGHIENLGLYPLLQRRCRLIVVIDGERDPETEEGHKFSALATAIRYARIDYGIDIEIDLSKVGGEDGKHFAVGKITYGKDFPHGRLVYVKSSLTGDENPYIREYWLKNPNFPHESTGDQFFDETQFECYRALGHHAVEDFLGNAAGDVTGDKGPRALFRQAKKKPRRAPRRKPSRAATKP